MNLNRREWLQGMACAGAVSATGKASALAAGSVDSNPETSVRMPRELGSPVTESLRPVVYFLTRAKRR